MTYLGRNVSEYDKAHTVNNDVGRAGDRITQVSQ